MFHSVLLLIVIIKHLHSKHYCFKFILSFIHHNLIPWGVITSCSTEKTKPQRIWVFAQLTNAWNGRDISKLLFFLIPRPLSPNLSTEIVLERTKSTTHSRICFPAILWRTNFWLPKTVLHIMISVSCHHLRSSLDQLLENKFSTLHSLFLLF